MKKHTWTLLNREQNKTKKLIYKCVTCDAQYIKKLNDDFLDDTQCTFNASENRYPKTPFNFDGFSGVIITSYGIEYVEDGKLHRFDGPAEIITCHVIGFNQRYWYRGKECDVDSAEELTIKILLE